MKKKILKISLTLLTLIIVVLSVFNFWIVESTRDLIYYDMDEVPKKRVALILGTSRRTTHGGNNKYFDERINTAALLYQKGIVKHIVVSGDNRTKYYNEPRDMYNALVDLGIPKSAITLDYAGFRTLDSIVRVKVVFGQDEIVIITQDFHCYRALFIANYYRIDAIAFSADKKNKLPFLLAARELLARFKAIVDLYIFDKSPEYMGKDKMPQQ